MAIKMTKLKQDKIRRTVYVTVNGNQETINVLNPTGTDRAELLRFMEEKMEGTDGTKLEVAGSDLMNIVYRKLTDIDFEESDDVSELLEMPSEAILLVHHEIQEVLQELMIELMIHRSTQMSLLQQELLMLDMAKRKEDIKQLISDKKILDDEPVKEIINELEIQKEKKAKKEAKEEE